MRQCQETSWYVLQNFNFELISSLLAVGLVCDEGGTELDADLICDGSADCEDGADEAACN